MRSLRMGRDPAWERPLRSAEAEAPEIAPQTDFGKYVLRFLRVQWAPVGAEAIAVPETGKMPALLQGEQPAALAVPLPAPALHVLFRPEQKHGFSGKDHIFIPAAGGHSDMDHSFILEQRVGSYLQDHLQVAAGTGGGNGRITS